jgi:crossover junction endodeoxyribonuclease RuvC
VVLAAREAAAPARRDCEGQPPEEPQVNRILGVDPGLTGAFALIGPDGTLVEDLPVIRDGKLAWIDAPVLEHQLRLIGCGEGTTAYVERVHAMPKNGCVGAFSQGLTLGSILAALQVVGVAIRLIPPQTWKRHHGLLGTAGDKLTDRERKQRSLDRARLLFPNLRLDRVKDHGRGEALLIAAYGQAQHAIPARTISAEAA